MCFYGRFIIFYIFTYYILDVLIKNLQIFLSFFYLYILGLELAIDPPPQGEFILYTMIF